MRLTHLLSVSILVLFLSSCSSQEPEKVENWIQLFNGKDLTGWDIKISGFEMNDNYNNTFIVEDGILKASYAEYDTFINNFGHLYYETPFSHYRLRIEYRLVGEQVPGAQIWANQNSGVMLHSQSAQQQEINQRFPASIEMQFLSAVEGENRKNLNLASPGTHVEKGDTLYRPHMMYSSYDAPPAEQWVSVEAIVLGDSIIHHVMAGDTVLTYKKPRIGGWEGPEGTSGLEDEQRTWLKENEGMPLAEGYIALQAEGHSIHFRKVELLDISEDYK